MMKQLLFILTAMVSFNAIAQQQGNFDAVNARQTIKLAGKVVNTIDDDTSLSAQSSTSLPTQYAVYTFALNRVNGILNGNNIFTRQNAFQRTDTLTSSGYGLLINSNLRLNADGIGGALLQIGGNVSNMGGHTGAYALAINSTSTLSSIFAGNLYMPKAVMYGLQINYDPTHTVPGPYNLDISDTAAVVMGRMFNSTKHFTWGNAVDYGKMFNVAGTMYVDGAATLNTTPNSSDADNDLTITSGGVITKRNAANATQLKAWTYSGSYGLTSVTRNSDDALVTASIMWPDGSTGTWTADVFSTDFPGSVDAYHLTYIPAVGVTRTITQTLLIRDASSGAVITRPALTVTP